MKIRRGLRACVAIPVVLATCVVLAGPTSATLPNWAGPSSGMNATARFYASMAYDPSTRNVVLFGGLGSSPYMSDTWTWDGTNWHNVTPTNPADSPPGRYSASMAYDPVTHNMVLFGGYDSNEFADTWLWDGTTWTNHTPSNPLDSPSPRYEASMVYDPATNDVVLFGGYDGHGNALSDTWIWDGTLWHNVTPADPARSPSPRYLAGMAYVPATHNMVLFAGGNTVGELSDTWVWDGTAWTQKSPATSPPSGGSMADDPSTGDVVLLADSVPGQSDTWVWDGTAWTEQLPAANPPGRVLASMADDPATNNVVLFGGSGVSGALSDTWTWHGFEPARTISIAPSPLPATAGLVKYEVEVTGAGATAPSGYVTVSDGQGGTCLNAALSSVSSTSATATCSMNESAGSSPYTITASYSGDSTYAAGATEIAVVGGVTSGGTASAVYAGLSATATGGTNGTDTVTATAYPSQPVNAPNFNGGRYFDVALSKPNTFTSVTIKFCDPSVSSTNTLFWFDPVGQSFLAVNPAPVYTPFSLGPPPMAPCLSITLDKTTTTPTLTQLSGTVFGVANPITPSPPLSVSGAPGNGQATVHWTKPLSNGGTPIISYTVMSYLAGVAKTVKTFGANATSGATGLLTNAKSYTFKVTATNAVGISLPSAVSKAITVGAPTAPTGVHAMKVAAGHLKLTFNASVSNGAPIQMYTATCKPSSLGVTSTKTGTATAITVTGLTTGKTYTCTVKATNSRGTGPTSSASAATNA